MSRHDATDRTWQPPRIPRHVPLVQPSFWDEFFPSDPGGWFLVKFWGVILLAEAGWFASILIRRFL